MMPLTRTAASPAPGSPARICARTASNTGWRALYAVSALPLTLSALARLLATVLSRTDCAAMPEPAMSKILNEDMKVSLLAGDGGHQRPELRRQQLQRRLVTHGVVGKRGLLQLGVDGIAVQ